MKEDRIEEEYESLTHAQRRIWYNELLYADTSINNIGGYVRIYGQIQLEVLDQAIQKMIENNDGYQIRLIKKDEDIKQYFARYICEETRLLDFSSEDNPEEKFLDWCKRHAGTPFELIEKPLYEFVRFKISDSDMGYYIKLHHIIADGWTIKIITDEVHQNYMNILTGIEEVEEYPSYRLYIEEEKKFLQSVRAEKNRNFWIEKLKKLPQDSNVASSAEIEGRRKVFQLTEVETNNVNQYLIKNNINLNVLFSSLFIVFLSKYLEKQNIVLGIPSYNRGGRQNKQIVGMFVNPLAEPFVINPEDDFLTCLKGIEKTMKECLYNQRYPYDQIISELNRENASESELYNICFNYYNTRLVTDWGGLPTENVEVYNGTQAYNLQLIVRDWLASNNIELDIDYKISCYQDEEIEQMFSMLRHLLHQIQERPDIPVEQYELLDEKMKQELIYEFNEGKWIEHTCSVVDLFEQQVLKSPEKDACESNGKRFTYTKLNEKINQMTHYLIKTGVKRGDCVALITENSIEAVIGIFAILKSGACYVPIVPDSAEERIRYILADANIKTIVTNQNELPELQMGVNMVSFDQKEIWLESRENPPKNHSLSDLCYMIYTSGSTGKPKGTMIEHKGLVNYISWAVKMYVEKDEVFPLFTSLAFDLTVTSIFTPLVSGNKIIVYPADQYEYPIEKILRDNKATIIKLTPSQLVLLRELNKNNTSVKKLIVGGEDLKVKQAKDAVQAFHNEVRIFNEYGPTETVVGSMIYEYSQERDTEGSVPIGRAIANTYIYLLDSKKRTVPYGRVGELYISGDGVCRGYLNNPEQTAKTFFDDPFLPGKRMYKTGDLAKFQGKNNLVYIGRMDSQVKIRGHRVELQEIENCLLQHESVDRVTVITQKKEKGETALSVFLKVIDEIQEKQLLTYMQERLPDYMIPVYITFVDEIPLTKNGKVDIKKLIQLQKETKEKTVGTERAADYSQQEQVLIESVKELLNQEEITPEDNFYYLGGDSIKAIQLANRMKSKGYLLSIKNILKYPELSKLAREMYEDKSKEQLLEDSHEIKNTPVLTWYFRELKEVGFVQTIVLDIENTVTIEQISWCLNKILLMHPALSYVVKEGSEKLFWRDGVQDKTISVLETYEELDKVHEQLKGEINLSKGELLRAALIHTETEKNKVMLVCNHLAVDMVSWIIILEDFDYLLTGKTKADLTIRTEKTSYAFWTEKMYRYGALVQDSSIAFWKQSVNELEQLTMWEDSQGNEDKAYQSFQLAYPAGILYEISEKLSMFYHINATSFFSVLIAFMWFQYQGNTEAAFTIEQNGRALLEDYDVSNTVGWFTQIYPLVLSCKSLVSMDERLKVFKENIVKAEKLARDYSALLMNERIAEAKWNQTIWLNFLGDMGHLLKNRQFSLADEMSCFYQTEDNCMTHPIEIIGWYQKDMFIMSIHYQTERFPEYFQEKVEAAWKRTVQELADFTADLNGVMFTPSDFDLAQLTQKEIDTLFQ